jgi:hypothetical protein
LYSILTSTTADALDAAVRYSGWHLSRQNEGMVRTSRKRRDHTIDNPVVLRVGYRQTTRTDSSASHWATHSPTAVVVAPRFPVSSSFVVRLSHQKKERQHFWHLGFCGSSWPTDHRCVFDVETSTREPHKIHNGNNDSVVSRSGY